MNVLFLAIPIALFISLVAVVAFVYLVKAGQFDDLETPPRRILFDDVHGNPTHQNVENEPSKQKE
jgi:cbb3-type cytochrome oxidase maturation protein